MKGIHWIIALLIIGQASLGWYMHDLPFRERFELTQLHKSIGFTILALVIVRLLWRLTSGTTPPLPPGMPGWQRWGAHISHVGLYLLMIALPVTGWIMVSSSNLGVPTTYFGLFEIPHIVGENQELSELMEEVHETLVWILIAFLAVHIAAALKHHIVNRDTTLVRMLPGRTPG